MPFILFLGFLLWPSLLLAHFQLLIPSQEVVPAGARQEVVLEMLFTHPAAGGPAMEMARPLRFGVLVRGQKIDLTSLLQKVQRPAGGCRGAKAGKVSAYQARYLLKRPGDHVFYLVPRPYFEAAEGRFIQQVTKVVVNAYGAEAGWDEAVGLPVEIIPLTRPYALFEGQVFRGLVLKGGKPAPFVEVEVEYDNRDCRLGLEGPFATQVLKTDAQGVFSFALPWAGWWGFSALLEGEPLAQGGRQYPLELDAVLWIKAHPRPQGAR